VGGAVDWVEVITCYYCPSRLIDGIACASAPIHERVRLTDGAFEGKIIVKWPPRFMM